MIDGVNAINEIESGSTFAQPIWKVIQKDMLALQAELETNHDPVEVIFKRYANSHIRLLKDLKQREEESCMQFINRRRFSI